MAGLIVHQHIQWFLMTSLIHYYIRFQLTLCPPWCFHCDWITILAIYWSLMDVTVAACFSLPFHSKSSSSSATGNTDPENTCTHGMVYKVMLLIMIEILLSRVVRFHAFYCPCSSTNVWPIYDKSHSLCFGIVCLLYHLSSW